jgi:hypothetical protein
MAVAGAKRNTHRGSAGRSDGGHGRGHGRSHSSHRNSLATAAAAQDTSQIVCYNCGQPGHIALHVVKPSRGHSKNCMMRLISTRRFKPYAYIV